MSARPELVRDVPSGASKSSYGPSWSSLVTFVVGFFTLLSVGLLIGLSFLVFELRETAKIQDLRLNKLERDYAVLEDRTKRTQNNKGETE